VATPSNLDEEFDDTEQVLTEWSGSYTSGRPTSTGTFTGSYSRTYNWIAYPPTFLPRSLSSSSLPQTARFSNLHIPYKWYNLGNFTSWPTHF